MTAESLLMVLLHHVKQDILRAWTNKKASSEVREEGKNPRNIYQES